MSIRLLPNTGSLPTSIVDGNLLIHGRNMGVVASIPLPFKKKYNGPISTERIHRYNVMIINQLDDGRVLVMRFDGTWTIYTSNMIPMFFGTYDAHKLLAEHLVVDPFGSYCCVPFGYKKKRMYKSYSIRYYNCNEIHYLIEYNNSCFVFTDTNDVVFKKIYIEGLNAGIAHHPTLEDKNIEGSLVYKGTYPIGADVLPWTEPLLQDRLARLKAINEETDTHVTMTRRRSYAEVDAFLGKGIVIPDYIEEMIDTRMLKDQSYATLPYGSDDVQNLIAYTMNNNPNLLVGSEINAMLIQYVDCWGRYTLQECSAGWEGEPDSCDGGLRIACTETDTKLCGYLAAPVAQISSQPLLPRVACKDGVVFVHGRKIPITAELAKVPDANMTGYIECIKEGKEAVIYLADGSYILI